MRNSIFILLSLLSVSAQPQNPDYKKAEQLYKEANILFEEESDEAALAKYQQAKRLYESLKAVNANYADLLVKMGSLAEIKNEPKAAINFYKAALALSKNNLDSALTPVFFTATILLGEVFYKTERYDSALIYCNQAKAFISKQQREHNIERLYNVLGAIYYADGNYRQSLTHFEKAFIASAQQQKTHPSILCRNQLNIASAANNLEQYERALQAYRQALSYKYVPEIVYRKIGETYLKLNKSDSALFFLQKSATTNNPDNRIVVWNHLGNLYAQRKDYIQSLNYYNQSIQLNQKLFGTKNTKLVTSYLGIGQVYIDQKHYLEAINTIQKALVVLHLSFKNTDIYINPDDPDNVISRLDFYKALRAKALALQKYAQQTRKSTDLEFSFKTYQLAIRLAERLRLSYDTDEAKLFFIQQVFPIYEEAISVAFTLYNQTKKINYTELAFSISEKSKAAVLAETLRGLQISQQKGVPTTLLQEEKELRRKITKLTIASIETKDSVQIVSLKDQIRDNEINLAQLIKKLDANEKYYQLKYNTQPVSLIQIQKKVLNSNTAFIEYFFGSQALYAFVITNEEFQVFQLPITPVFKDALTKYTLSLFDHHPSPIQPIWANILYQNLITPLRPVINNYQKLIIVPDGELSYLPFEALVKNPNSLHYLLDDYIIRYAYSGTLLEFTNPKQNVQNTGEVLAMAPFAGSTGNSFRSIQISPLPASKAEVETIGGHIFLESAATKEVFLKLVSQSGIIHLATHATADSKEPLNSYITFYPKDADSLSGYRLYTSELYNLQLDNVKLVVLSACETGGGKLVRGEGVMSLARAFAYAGCPNIAMTLWRADDKATAQITTRMYEYLKKGYTKDEALNKAKQDYLQEAPSSRRNPYYWANMVLVGDEVPVYTSYRWIWIIGGILLALIGTGIFLRTTNKQKKHLTLEKQSS
ncbi:CHAT domain-containing protein [Cytophagaceae bacterium DM2B3-1]|uniref:CHAT domain-containing protein n=1 Tax=Xanthocytophaga flava TaxID=3048013 RepID=A0ABT7CPW3_9BACT|nr:CHAT domain-containing protein [Xanthocytophaga flavus]MDJ1495784.1 CHAT domain-containing protein [Xanthocytophaga flavus]